jgi:hypothetical protein
MTTKEEHERPTEGDTKMHQQPDQHGTGSALERFRAQSTLATPCQRRAKVEW